MPRWIDLNCDMGEIPGDDLVMPFVTSANIACGGHAGDVHTIKATVEHALRHHVAIGAHPGYPDRANFGRVEMTMSPEAVADTVFEQLQFFAEAAAVPVTHVKPHGAMYNQAAKDPVLAAAIANGVARWSNDVVMVGLAGSIMLDVFLDAGFAVAAEAFADRRYEDDGSLRSRKFDDALITDPVEAGIQALRLVDLGIARTICIHGDTPNAVKIAEAVSRTLEHAGVTLRTMKTEVS